MIIITSFPQQAYADGEPYYPVFYYYHSDHLGSASVMTNRQGTFVQHYAYTAFGHQRYQNNSSAFSVTRRYTGQQLDEDTGLYFYNSRYYDPQLARFIQADTIVPSANTSQALNRYAYVKNNPLKFTDPSGHGWFKKFFKKWIGTIIMIGLTLAFGIGSTFFINFVCGTLYSAIGAAVSTIVNGGSWKSFAIGVAIGAIASAATVAIGGYLAKGYDNWGAFVQKGPIEAALAGALQGSISGGLTSAVYGQNVGKGMAEGGMYGAAGGAAMHYIAPVLKKTYNFIEERLYDAVNGVINLVYAVETRLMGLHCNCGPQDMTIAWRFRRALQGWPIKFLTLSHSGICLEDPRVYGDATNAIGMQPRAAGLDGSQTEGPGKIEPEWENKNGWHRDFSDIEEVKLCPHQVQFLKTQGQTPVPYRLFNQSLLNPTGKNGINCHDAANGRFIMDR